MIQSLHIIGPINRRASIGKLVSSPSSSVDVVGLVAEAESGVEWSGVGSLSDTLNGQNPTHFTTTNSLTRLHPTILGQEDCLQASITRVGDTNIRYVGTSHSCLV